MQFIAKVPINDGYVQLVAVDGSEQRIIDVARLSHGSISKGAEHDTRLLKQIITDGHLSCLEFASLLFKLKCPIFVARQLMRYRLASYMEKSRRYNSDTPEFWLPDIIRVSHANDAELMASAYEESIIDYEGLLLSGTSPEVARAILPQAMYTEFYWYFNISEFLHILSQRLAKNTQAETYQFAAAMYRLAFQHGFAQTLTFAELKNRPKAIEDD